MRITKKNNDKYYYSLERDDAVKVRWLGVIGIFTTLNLVGGFYFFASHSLVALILFTPLSIIVILYQLINAIIMSQYPAFSIRNHNDRVRHFKQIGNSPKVAVMIPAAGEPLSVLRETIEAAVRINYPNFDVYVLDDSKPGMYKDLALSLGVKYFRRSNVGVHKKAGNMNALIKKVGEKLDYILVLDADFVPSSEILSELVPYAGEDVGIVQSPQHFRLSKEIYRRSKFEYGAALIQRDFYRITQPARSSMGGSICVGTNALYNVRALEQVGGYEGVGPADWGHSEDVYTGLKMLNSYAPNKKHYKISYVPVMLAQGTCPDDHLSFYKQQNRWATGSMQLIFSKLTLLSPNLSLAQKLCYFSNSTYYFYTMALLFSPIQILYIALTNVHVDWSILLLFIPSLLLNFLVTPIILRRTFNPIAGSLAVISNAYTFVQALFLVIIRRPLGWEATGAKSTKKKNTHFIAFKILCSVCFVGIYLVTLGVTLINQRLEFSPSIVLIISFLIGLGIHLIYLHHMFTNVIVLKKAYRSIHAYAYVALIALTLVVISSSIILSTKYDIYVKSRTLIIEKEQ
ncbi:MAG: glycosyltransferase [Candidatus Saccharimonadales bacterium]